MGKIKLGISIFCIVSALALSRFVQHAQADVCLPATTAPVIYQITRTSTNAILYFTPINDQIRSYTIIYGFSSGDERYSATFNSGVSTGAISYTINNLQPTRQYFYKVRGNTSCTYSPWSSWVGDKITTSVSTASVKSKVVPAVPVTGSETFGMGMLVTCGAFLAGLCLFLASSKKRYG